jgi:dethiobiotin synthetase
VKLFVTGSDTGVGKTYLSSLLVRALRARGLDTVGFKPICCGERDDALLLQSAAEGKVSLNDVNPVWLRVPAAPYAASLIEGRPIDLDLVRRTFTRLSATHSSMIVEGVGGWRVPITRDYFLSDLATEFALPVVAVVPNRLGTLNHALLTVEAIRAAGLVCAGIILNHLVPPADPPEPAVVTNRAVLEEVVGVPILYEIEYGQNSLTL